MGSSTPELPPGFRFHPTDEELMTHYLRNQVLSMPCPVSIIPELNIYKFDPWELPQKSEFGEGEWYFFSPRDRKYPNGARPNRATASGYWKATGTDKAIYSKSHYVGVKKALVFYKGRPPKGSKTGWIMHEYRLSTSISKPMRPKGSMRLDDWVLCRIHEKNPQKKITEETMTSEREYVYPPFIDEQKSTSPLRFPRSCSLAHLLEAEYMSIKEMLNDYPLGSSDEFHVIASSFECDDAGESDGNLGLHVEDGVANPMKITGNHSVVFNKSNHVDQQQQPIFQY